MTKEEQVIKIHETSIEELRKMHEALTTSYTETKTKILTFMGGGLAFLSFIYANNKLFFPEIIYGKIFYVVGLTLCVFSLSLLFFAIQPVFWTIPAERKKHIEITETNYLTYLKYIKETYLEAIENNLQQYEKKQKYLNLAASLLVVGAILLIVIKNFNY